MSVISLDNYGSCITTVIEYRDGEVGGFSMKGITTSSTTGDDNILSCFSSHLTSFAVLVDAAGNTVIIATVYSNGCL